ncbi:MAG: NAD(P)/FAD-dependent oxidoreductase [Dehalococcoidia bacterium]|nr:NAD(P)/FAD-dependent oxidoreductase [Dehalococcoidia bacterium]
MNSYKYVIVGNSAGALAAAREIRRFDSNSPMLMVSDEPYAAYSRPLIAKHISESKSIDAMLLVRPEYYEGNDIELKLATRATRVEADARRLHLDDGSVVSWENLLLATGGTPIVPPIPGNDRYGVFTFTRYDDARAIAQRLSAVRRACIIGGGFIGLSAADALRKRHIEVTVIEMQPRLLSAMLDMAASCIAEDAAVAAGVQIETGRRVVSINGDHPESRAVSSVTLDNGTRIQCELVILAVGVRPRTELAEGVVTVERGIVVDSSMRTSDARIFACGDVSQTHDIARESDAVLAIWPNAVAGGTAAGAAMAGQHRLYEGGTTLNALPYFGLSLGSAGVVDHDPSEHDIVVASGPRFYRKVVLKDGSIIGMVFAGDTSKCGLLYTLMKRKVDVSECKAALVSDDFGLLSLPRGLWQSDITAH